MVDTNIRRYVQGGFDVVARGSGLVRLSPNTITVVAFIIGGVSAVALGFGFKITALSLLWLSGLLDVLDGTVARLTNKSSKLGGYLDLVFDRLVEAFMIIAFFVLMPQNTIHYLIFLTGVIFNFSTFMLAASLFENKGVKSAHYDIGIVERTETFILFSLMILFSNIAFVFIIIFNLLMFITGIIRMIRIVKHEKSR